MTATATLDLLCGTYISLYLYVCGHPKESTEHLLLDRFMYDKERKELIFYLQNTRGVLCNNSNTYSRETLVKTLLNGEDHHNYDRYPYN